MDQILENYRVDLEHRCGKSVPKFDSKSGSSSAIVLALFQDPGESGAEVSGIVSIDNNDPTAKQTKKMVEDHGIERKEVLFWNFYASYNLKLSKTKPKIEDKKNWAKHLELLVDECKRLKLIICHGKLARDGMAYFNNKRSIPIISAPHPSRRGMTQPNAKENLKSAWKRVKEILENE